MTLKEKAALLFEAVKKQFDVLYATAIVLDTLHYEDAVQILAKEYGCSKLLITKLLKFFNIKKSKEAINNLRVSTNVSKYGKGGAKKRLELPKDSLLEMYLEERLSLELIAAKFDVSLNKVRTELARYDIHRKADYVITEAIKQKRRDTCLAKYGVENPMLVSSILAKSILSKVDLYGEDWARILAEKSFATYKERTGLDNPFQDTLHLKEVLLEKYGVENNNLIPGVKEKISAANKKTNNLPEVKEKRKNTNLKRYGVTAPAKNSEVQKKIQSTCLERYGVANIFNSPDLKYNLKKKYSKPNENFYNLLIKYFDKEEIDNGREFTIGLKLFDFKIGKYLIEINPWVTHNSDFSPYGNKVGLDKYYHLIKSKVAKEAGFLCIHVFDWDNTLNIILSILRNEVKEVIDFSEPLEIIFNYKLKCIVDTKTECCVSIFTDGACY